MKFGFVAKHRVAWPVAMLCEALGVSRSGFYAWLIRPRSRRNLEDERLTELARRSFLDSDRTYGARRVWRDVLASGQCCGLHRIERLMQAQVLRARPRRRGLPVDRGTRSGVAPIVSMRRTSTAFISWPAGGETERRWQMVPVFFSEVIALS